MMISLIHDTSDYDTAYRVCIVHSICRDDQYRDPDVL